MDVKTIDLLGALNIKLKKRSFLVTYHPLTANPSAGFLELLELLQALEKYEDCSIIFTMPNADADGLQLAKTLKTFADAHINTYYFSSLGQEKYFSCLSNFDAVIGNSSSSLLEAPSFKIPTINIGDRQKGRLKAESVIDCEAKKENIQQAIQKALSPEFIKKTQKTNKNPKNPKPQKTQKTQNHFQKWPYFGFFGSLLLKNED